MATGFYVHENVSDVTVPTAKLLFRMPWFHVYIIFFSIWWQYMVHINSYERRSYTFEVIQFILRSWDQETYGPSILGQWCYQTFQGLSKQSDNWQNKLLSFDEFFILVWTKTQANIASEGKQTCNNCRFIWLIDELCLLVVSDVTMFSGSNNSNSSK